VAAERSPGDVLVDAVAEARRIRGSVNVEPDDSRRWSAVVAAVDGSLELRVAEPRRRFWKGTGEQTRWLREHGFEPAFDCWVLPLARETRDGEAAERWAEALDGGLGVDPESVRRGYVGRGVPEHDVPHPSAPHSEHITAAMHAVVRGEFDRVNVFGGRPSKPWAWVWDTPDQPGLLIECLHRDDPGDGEKDEWHVPRTLDGCREGSRELLRRLSPEWPDAEAVPLFIHLLTPRG
jgi:hypothetical protein